MENQDAILWQGIWEASKKRMGWMLVLSMEKTRQKETELHRTAQGCCLMPGADVITTGNHVLKRKEIFPKLDEQNGIIRPANYHHSAPGTGVFVLDKLRWQLCVINLQGQAGMEPCGNPFEKIDQLLQELPYKNILVDFHAEMTSEKKAMGYYLDGRVSAVLGTHTHVQTADERILPKGTAYITDAGNVRRQKLSAGCKKRNHYPEVFNQSSGTL